MARSKGSELEVRIADSEAGLATAPTIPYIQSAEWNPGQAFEHAPKGFGSRQQDVMDGLVAPTLRITRHYDSTAVKGTDIFWNAVQSTNTGAVTAQYVEIRNKITVRKTICRGVKGNCPTSADIDGRVTEVWSALCEEMSESAY